MVTRDQDFLEPNDLRLLDLALLRRLAGEPLAYVCGFKDFYKHRFLVGPGVLIPRPETEIVVEAALDFLPQGESRIADFGAGTGCIGISILLERPAARLVAVEKSPDALKYLRRNIKELGVGARTEVAPIAVEELPDKDFDLIVANPPYIAPTDPNVEENVRRFEPALALFSDGEGLGAIHRWLDEAARILKVNGRLIMEVGAGQSKILREYSVQGLKFDSVKRDLAGHERVLIWRKT